MRVCTCRSQRNIGDFVRHFVSVCFPVLYRLCVCESVCLCSIQMWFSTVQHCLNGHAVCAAFPTPTAALHPLPRSKCCTHMRQKTGAPTLWLNPSSSPHNCTLQGVLNHLCSLCSSKGDIEVYWWVRHSFMWQTNSVLPCCHLSFVILES